MIRILHTADIHLDAPFPFLGDKESQRREDFLKTFENLLTIAIKKEVHLFLVSGDLFDSPRPAPTVVARVQAGLKRLKNRGILPVLLPGTRDTVLSADSVYRTSDFSAIVLDKPEIEAPVQVTVAGRQVCLYGFASCGFSASVKALDSMRRRYSEGVHIGLAHGSCVGTSDRVANTGGLCFPLAQLKAWGLDYVALGSRPVFEPLADGDRIFAAYPGSPEARGFSEDGQGFCALVSIDGGRVDVEPLAVSLRMMQERELDLSGCHNDVQVLSAVETLGDPNLLLRLVLTGILDAPLDLPHLRNRCSNRFFYLEFDDQTRLFDSSFFRRIEKEDTVRGVFARRVREVMEQVEEERRPLVDAAFREVMLRFRAFGGDA